MDTNLSVDSQPAGSLPIWVGSIILKDPSNALDAWQQPAPLIVLYVLVVVLLLGGIFLLIRRLYSRLSAAQRKIHEMTPLDDLTKVYNRRYFLQVLEQEVARVKRYQIDLGCILLDLDHFQEINATYGRESGDLALKAVAGCLTKNTRQSDVVARFAGEEFVILLPHTSLSNARLAAEKICKAIADIEVNGSNGSAKGTFQLSASLGVAFLNPTEGEQALESMLRRVDQALNRAKNEGHNCVRG